MGKLNNTWNHYLRNKRRFADLYNGIYFRGQQLIQPQELDDASEIYTESETGSHPKKEHGKRLERIRDIKMSLKNGQTLCVLGVENQNAVNYSMPLRCMQYDAMEYEKQLNDLRDRHRTANDYTDWSEKASGMTKTDRLTPVSTLCLYHGETVWDGPRTLKDMMQFDESYAYLQELFADYPFRLYCINEETDFSVFHTELRQVFELLHYRTDKAKLWELIENHSEYHHMDADTLEIISVTLNIPVLWRNREKYMKKSEDNEEEYNMCKALEELFADAQNAGIEIGKKNGLEIGRRDGIEEKTCQIVINMLHRGMNDEDIRAIAECSQETINKVRETLFQ